MVVAEPVMTYKVFYRPNPAYKGSYLRDKIGKGGIHGTFGPENGGLEQAEVAVEKCKAWFNEERIRIERQREKRKGEKGGMDVEIKVIPHDNVIVWIETYKDGFKVIPNVEEPKKEPVK